MNLKSLFMNVVWLPKLKAWFMAFEPIILTPSLDTCVFPFPQNQVVASGECTLGDNEDLPSFLGGVRHVQDTQIRSLLSHHSKGNLTSKLLVVEKHPGGIICQKVVISEP